MPKSIIIYSADWCGFCHRVKDYLKSKNIPFEVLDVDSNPKYAEDCIRKSGQSGIPVLDIDGQIVVGFNVKKINELVGIEE